MLRCVLVTVVRFRIHSWVLCVSKLLLTRFLGPDPTYSPSRPFSPYVFLNLNLLFILVSTLVVFSVYLSLSLSVYIYFIYIIYMCLSFSFSLFHVEDSFNKSPLCFVPSRRMILSSLLLDDLRIISGRIFS